MKSERCLRKSEATANAKRKKEMHFELAHVQTFDVFAHSLRFQPHVFVCLLEHVEDEHT